MRGDRFATTHWSMVMRAGRCGGQGSDFRSSEANRALATLCENYWFPLYAFVRRAGHSAQDAQDLTQEFFLQLLSQKFLAVADRHRGRFRSYLLGALKHFLAKQWRRRGAQKRGGRQSILSLDFDTGESRYRQMEPVDSMTPERLYEKRWALSLLDLVLRRLREEFVAAETVHLFDSLKPFLVGGHETPAYREVAEQLGVTEGAVKVAVHRLRRRYRGLLKEEIAQTIGEGESLDDELSHLLAALGSGK